MNSPTATAAWLTRRGPPSMWTIHHMSGHCLRAPGSMATELFPLFMSADRVSPPSSIKVCLISLLFEKEKAVSSRRVVS